MEPEAHAAQPFEPSCLRMQPSTSPLHSTKAFTHIAVATVNRYRACPRAHPQQELEAPSHKNFKYHVEVAYQTRVRPFCHHTRHLPAARPHVTSWPCRRRQRRRPWRRRRPRKISTTGSGARKRSSHGIRLIRETQARGFRIDEVSRSRNTFHGSQVLGFGNLIALAIVFCFGLQSSVPCVAMGGVRVGL